jgi:hypothetical protein
MIYMNTAALTAGAELKMELAKFLTMKMEQGCTLAQAGEHMMEHLRRMAAEQAAWDAMMAELAG